MRHPAEENRRPIRVIEPPPVPPVGARRAAGPSRTARVAAVLGLVVLTSVALSVVFVLPDLVAERGEQPVRDASPQPVPERPPAPVAPAVAARDGADPQASTAPVAASPPAAPVKTALQLEAETALARALKEKAALDVDRAPVWGEQDYQDVLAEIDIADAHFAAARFAQARDAYRGALESLALLRSSMPARLDRALADGALALAQGDGLTARERYDVALAIDPDHAGARTARERAETIEQVVALYEAGTALEEAGDLEAAREKFQRARELDPAFEKAGRSLARVEQAMTDAALARAMTRGLAHLDRGELDAARRALTEAKRIAPRSTPVRDALSRLAIAERHRAIARHRREAERLEADERMREAAAAYEEALALDANLAFARAGRERTRSAAALFERIDDFLEKPGRLQSDAPLAEAKQLLAFAAARASGPKLEAKRARLGELVQAAQTPVQVLLRSDTHTEVLVQRVGRLGRFSERVIRLRPGRYTAVGSRVGYRDVRVEFSVGAGAAPHTVLVRCEEPV